LWPTTVFKKFDSQVSIGSRHRQFASIARMGGRSLATDDVSQLGRDIFPDKQQPAAGRAEKQKNSKRKKLAAWKFFSRNPNFVFRPVENRDGTRFR